VSLNNLLAIAAAGGFISAILFVIFGQITVRKLRKNPETKQALGFEFASGWDILNVAEALTLPKAITRRAKRNAGIFQADPDLLYKHTTLFDRVLARSFYLLLYISGITFVITALLMQS